MSKTNACAWLCPPESYAAMFGECMKEKQMLSFRLSFFFRKVFDFQNTRTESDPKVVGRIKTFSLSFFPHFSTEPRRECPKIVNQGFLTIVKNL